MSDAILYETWVTTRKSHKCFGCRAVMPAGTKMLYEKGVTDGEFWSYYLCRTCDDWIQDHRDHFKDGIDEGDVKMDMEEAERDASRA